MPCRWSACALRQCRQPCRWAPAPWLPFSASTTMAFAPPVPTPFHSSLIRPAADKLAARLAELNLAAPQIPVINNVDVAIETDVAKIKDALVRQAYNPVRWVETVQKMAGMGVTMAAECGPGKVLAGLTKRCGADNINGVA